MIYRGELRWGLALNRFKKAVLVTGSGDASRMNRWDEYLEGPGRTMGRHGCGGKSGG
jgi:hypothetical protein